MAILNKETIRILKYIKKHGTPSEGDIIKKFGEDGTTLQLISLCQEQYLLCQKSDGTFEEFTDIPYVTACDYRYWATPKADLLLENKSLEFWKWVLPTIISVAALIFSILSFILSAFNDSPILVKILQ